MSLKSCIPVPCVIIGEDGLSVTLKASEMGDEAAPPTAANVLAYLESLGVDVPDVKAIERLAGDDGRISVTDDVVLVQGRRPVPERPGSVTLLVRAGQTSEEIEAAACQKMVSSVSHYERTSHAVAVAGQAIATITPITPGVDGRDVFGNPIPHARVCAPVELCRNVELGPDGVTVHATVAGRVRMARRKLWVETAVKIPGDVNFGCGNIDVAGDVFIGGSVLDNFKVRGANVDVAGAIEAAEVQAAEDLQVRGGILGKGKGRCQAGGEVACKYVTNSTIVAGGNVTIRGEIAHTRIICRGRLAAETAAITSGHITANGGVACRSLGSVIEAQTVIELGIDEILRSQGPNRMAEINAEKTRAAHRIETASQLLRFQKTLSAQQKEQATELLRQANEYETSAAALLRPLVAEVVESRQNNRPQVVVEDVLHAGVVVRFPNAETTILSDWQGPLRLTVEIVDALPCIVLTDLTSNSTHPLPSRSYHDAAYEVFLRSFPSA